MSEIIAKHYISATIYYVEKQNLIRIILIYMAVTLKSSYRAVAFLSTNQLVQILEIFNH